MLPHQRSWRCQPSASLPSAPPTGSCSWGSVPQWLHLSLQITFKKLSLDSMPQAEMAGYPSKLQLGDKDPPHPWPLQSPSRFRHPGLEQPNAYLLLVRVRQEAAAFLQGSQDLLLCAVFLQVAVQIAHQPLAHLTEATVLQRCHTRCVRKRAQAQRRPGPLSPRGGRGGCVALASPTTGLTSQHGQPLGGAEMEHAAHQLRARLLQEERQDGAAVRVDQLLALLGHGRGQLGAHFVQSMNDFLLKREKMKSWVGVGVGVGATLKLLMGPGNQPTNSQALFSPPKATATTQGKVASPGPGPEGSTCGKWVYQLPGRRPTPAKPSSH